MTVQSSSSRVQRRVPADVLGVPVDADTALRREPSTDRHAQLRGPEQPDHLQSVLVAVDQMRFAASLGH